MLTSRANVSVEATESARESPDGNHVELVREQSVRVIAGADADADTTDRGDEVVILEPSMIQIHQLARRVAASDISVLLLGETGSGKEILAETIHRHSARRDKPMLRLNCAAISESLLESELFGHEKGSFSGAAQAKSGLLEMVNGGTVFLDEVGEMPLSLQAKLLRVIEDRKVTRVGGLKPRDINVRFVTATNRNLAAEVARGAFRADLYYRFNGISLELPPLRERLSEIEPLVLMFLNRTAKQIGRKPPTLSPEVRAMLRRHPWPGNIRELRNLAERALVVCGDGEMITVEHLPVGEMARAACAFARASDPLLSMSASTIPPPLGDAGPGRSERQRITDALQQCAGNQSSAAKMLGISRTTLVSRLIEYNLPRPRARRRKD
ncbi:sigma-54 interaction domain-containing protein [Pendulispora albinea]|uniref:Sigma-54 dependent transcriptional regulator n=1 Tax=Pendulispora albinea TaxID=2741071 RepID=A0ABZ2M3B4_9BACT